MRNGPPFEPLLLAKPNVGFLILVEPALGLTLLEDDDICQIEPQPIERIEDM